jgi:hypothetical protein
MQCAEDMMRYLSFPVEWFNLYVSVDWGQLIMIRMLSYS